MQVILLRKKFKMKNLNGIKVLNSATDTYHIDNVSFLPGKLVFRGAFHKKHLEVQLLQLSCLWNSTT